MFLLLLAIIWLGISIVGTIVYASIQSNILSIVLCIFSALFSLFFTYDRILIYFGKKDNYVKCRRILSSLFTLLSIVGIIVLVCIDNNTKITLCNNTTCGSSIGWLAITLFLSSILGFKLWKIQTIKQTVEVSV